MYFKSSSQNVKVALARIEEVDSCKNVGREVASKEFMQSGPEDGTNNILIDTVWESRQPKIQLS